MTACLPHAINRGFTSICDPSLPQCLGSSRDARRCRPGLHCRPLAAGGRASLGYIPEGHQQLLVETGAALKPSAVRNVTQGHAGAVNSGPLSQPLVGSKVAAFLAENTGTSAESTHSSLGKMPERTVPLYANLIGSFARTRRWRDVLATFALMVGDDVKPGKFLWPKILKACSELEVLSTGAVLHGYMLKQWKQLQLDAFVSNSLIDMYAKCGDLDSSWAVFHTMIERDVVSWTALLMAYTEAGLMDDAEDTFNAMRSAGVKPDLISWNTLISGFARKGETASAIDFLEEMKQNGLEPGVNTWNGVISGFVQSGCFEEALYVFCEMCLHSKPNSVTVASILPACSSLGLLTLGEGLHAYAIKHDFLKNVFVRGSLIDMYMKCHVRDHAEKLFSGMKTRTATVWNEMISAYASDGKLHKALDFLQLMLEDGLKPDIITYNTVLAAYARSGQKNEAYKLFSEMNRFDLKPNIVSLNAVIAGFQHSWLCQEALNLLRVMQHPEEIHTKGSCSAEDFPAAILDGPIQPNAVTITSSLSACSDLKRQCEGMQIHGYAIRNSFESNIFVSTALVDMYTKCEDMDYALRVFYGIKEKNTVTWNTLMAGYNFNMEPENALELFPKMLLEGQIPSSITILILLLACSSTSALSLGRELHSHIVKSIFDEPSHTVYNALVDMYAKCGSIQEARLAFDCTFPKDLALWNTMISAYSLHGMTKDAMSMFDQMERSDIKPDHITFTSILSACRQESFIEEGWKYFNSMEDVYGIKPTLEHYTCMVGLMGAVGLLEKALDFIKTMPFEPDACVWAALLRGCRLHSNYEVGQKAARALFELEPKNSSNYIILSNIYAAAGMWDAAMDVRISMRARGLKPVTARSWIYSCKKIHTFKAGDSSHHQLDRILEEWDRLAMEMDKYGYVPQDVFLDEEDADAFSCFHTEKLAICFGIISLPSHSPIRISKNVRMCIDCHTSAKFISLIEGREVFLKDGCFYHHFNGGICSCNDRW